MENGIVLTSRNVNNGNVHYFDRENLEFAQLNARVQKRWDDREKEKYLIGVFEVERARKQEEKEKFVIKTIFKILMRIAQIWFTCMFMSEGWVRAELTVFVILYCMISACVQIGRCIERVKKDV